METDKKLHFMVGFGITSASSIGFFAYGMSAQKSSLLAGLLCLFAGTAKEIYDYISKDKHTPDIMDALYTYAGGFLGLTAMLLMSKFL